MAIEANGKKTVVVWRLMSLPKADNNVVSLVPVLLRLAVMLATVTAALVMGINTQTKSTAIAIVGTTTIFQTLTAKFNHTPAFVYFVIANAVASVYNLLVLLSRFFFLKCKTYDRMLHLIDML